MKKTDAFLKSLFAFVLFSAFALAAVAAPFKTPFTKKRVLCDAAQCCDCSFELADSGYPLAPAAEQKSGAKEIFDLVSPELIEFFEQNFAKCDLITGMKPQRVQKLMKAYGVSEKALRAYCHSVRLQKKRHKSDADFSFQNVRTKTYVACARGIHQVL